MAIKYDPVGKLIQQLQVVRDDIAYLQRIGEKPDVEQYPVMKERLQRLIFTSKGKFTPHITRLERAGFLIAKVDDVIYIVFEQTGGKLSFQWVPLAERTTNDHYQPNQSLKETETFQ